MRRMERVQVCPPVRLQHIRYAGVRKVASPFYIEDSREKLCDFHVCKLKPSYGVNGCLSSFLNTRNSLIAMFSISSMGVLYGWDTQVIGDDMDVA